MTNAPLTVNYEHTPESLSQHILERKGCPVHYWIGGLSERPLVILMHGGAMDHRMFNPQVEALLPHYRVLVWDCRGHGQSQPMGDNFSLQLVAEDMLAILDHEQIEEAIIGGQSMGGMVAQYIYSLIPGRIRAMIMIDSASIARAYSRFDVLATRWSVPLIQLFPYNYFRRITARTAVIDPVAQDYAYHAMGQMSKSDFIHFWQGISRAITRDGIPGYRIEVPMLLLHGDKDRNGTIIRDAKEWATAHPDVDYRVITEAAHNANQDNPAEVNSAILDFLAQRLS